MILQARELFSLRHPAAVVLARQTRVWRKSYLKQRLRMDVCLMAMYLRRMSKPGYRAWIYRETRKTKNMGCHTYWKMYDTPDFASNASESRDCVLNWQSDDTGNQHITKGCTSGNQNNQHQTSHQPFLHCEEETGNKNHQQKYNQRYSNYLHVRLQNRVNLHVY